MSFRPTVGVVATPAPLHIPQAIRLAEAGAHVLIEKPLSTSPDGLDELRRLLVQRRLTAGVAYVLRSHPALEAMREAIRSGKFGRPLQVVAVSGQHFPTYRPAYASTYYANRQTGGGAIQDALTHLINAVEWLVGPADRVIADAAHRNLATTEVEDTAHVLARHGEVLASYALNQYQAPNESLLTIVCEGGTLRFDPPGWRWMTDPGGEWRVEGPAALERDELFIRQANLFLDAVEAGTLPRCTLDEGAQTLRVNLAALRSLDTGRWESTQQEGETP